MPQTDRPVVVHLRKTTWIILGIVLIAPWLLLVMTLRDRPTESPPPIPAGVPRKSTGTAPSAGADLTRGKPGPWGELEYFRILIEPPEQIISIDNTTPDPIRWTFKDYTPTALETLWREAGLNAAQQKALIDPAWRTQEPGAIVIRPTREFVIGLSPQARAKIYGALAAFSENGSQFSPFRLRADAAVAWLDDSGLSPATIALTRKMFYERGTGTVFFSDEDVVLPTLESPSERVKFLKTLARKSALMVQLRVRPDSDVEAIARYWGHSRRAKDLRPFLQSIARRPGGGTIDIVHLLPTVPRSLLYTYPLPPAVATQPARDCLWTSLNFFNDPPDDRFTNPEFVRQVLMTDYYAVPGEPTYGDIVAFVRPDGVVLHACVYLADNLVYTKNGAEFSVPWQIAPIDGVRDLYRLISPSFEIRRYRRNDR